MKPDSKSQKRKYAFNINDIKSKKKFQGSLHDFQKLNRGLYDEIENQDISIKENKNKLKKIKNSAVKEFVYTNRAIPDHWKTKFDYEQNLLKTFVKDKNFLYYLGHGGGGDNPRFIKEAEKNNSSGLNLNKSPNNDKNSFPNIDNKNSSSPVKSSSNKHIIRNRFKGNNYTDKEILGILDDFRNEYPLFDKEKNQDIHTKENMDKEGNIDIDIKSKTFYNNNINNKNILIQNNNNKNIKKNSIENYNHTLTNFPSIRQKHNKRQNTFRQNIFTNLLPSSNRGKNVSLSRKNGFSSCTNFRKKRLDIQNKNNIFLNSDNEIFDRKININNPAILKYLEGINFFGPYFSYCPPCGNRNLEFYNNLEANQCLQIIQQIKKNKGKNIIINKKKENLINKVEEINRNAQGLKENKNNFKYNSESINYNSNNNYESDNNSMIQQISKDSRVSYDKEQFDVFN